MRILRTIEMLAFKYNILSINRAYSQKAILTNYQLVDTEKKRLLLLI